MARKILPVLALLLGCIGLSYYPINVWQDFNASPAKPEPLAIGAMRRYHTCLRPPREDMIKRWLYRHNRIPLKASKAQVKAAVRAYCRNFAKQTDTWISPQAKALALRREAELTADARSGTRRLRAVQPVTATVLALAVDFAGTDTITYKDDNNEDLTVTVSGPRQGEIPHPGLRDNNTLWYTDEQTTDAKFYEQLIFGYQGAGRVRLDLIDPNDGQPGINLSGYTVQDYYDHVAGSGNVTLSGSVQGWVQVNHSEGYYGAPNLYTGQHDGGAGIPVAQLAVEAVQKFNELHPDYYHDTGPDAFWPKYDANHDGMIDTLWIIHGGMGQESDGGAQGELAIWSHSSDLRISGEWPEGYKVYEGDPETAGDDLYVGPYTMQPENLDVGVLCEEFGHNFFALPDLYVNDGQGSIGFWNIMEGGAWGGWLGGATPVGMPLWFRMIAENNGVFLNWQEPMAVRNYNDPKGNITIGQLESTPPGIAKGVQISLPDTYEYIPNRSGNGKCAYSGKDTDNLDAVLEKTLTIPKNAKGLLSFDTYWDLEPGYDYGYLSINHESRPDLDGYCTADNPYGANSGWGLTGASGGVRCLRFDLSVFRGQTIELQLRYKTDSAITGAGWWIDNLKLDGKIIDDFETASPDTGLTGWINPEATWQAAPLSRSFAQYYLLEWRAATKYDQMVKTAYVTSYSDEDEWQVQRVPYNIPGALLYYRNTRYSSTYSFRENFDRPPSYGPKYQLLVVDMHYQPLRIGDLTPYGDFYELNARASSYDAALSLQPTLPFILTEYAREGLSGNWEYASKPENTNFDDARGYYAGFWFNQPPEDPRWLDQDGSAVIPASGTYSTRACYFDGSPNPGQYDTPATAPDWLTPSWFGTGNPGDAGVQYGLKLSLISKSDDNQTASIRFNANPPDPPVNQQPDQDAAATVINPELSASPFHDSDAGDSHKASQWRIREAKGGYHQPVYDSGAVTQNKTGLKLPSGILNPGCCYYWQVRYQDNNDAWSDWSAETRFTTAQAIQLQAGWNTVSFPLKQVTATSGFEYCLYKFNGSGYEEINPSTQPESIDCNCGYWTYSDDARQVSAGGNINTEPGKLSAQNLQPGWNLIGLPYPAEKTFNSIMLQVGEQSQSLSAAASGNIPPQPGEWLYHKIYCYKDGWNQQDAKDGSQTLKPFTGYWLWSWQAAELILETPVNFTSMTSGTLQSLKSAWGEHRNALTAVGSAGIILQFNGNGWLPMPSMTSEDLNSVWGSSEDNLYAAGANQTILHYNGSAWEIFTTGGSSSFNAVWGTAPDNVYFAGDNGFMLHFNGQDWEIEFTRTDANLNALWGNGSNNIYAAGSDGTIIHNGGYGWSVMSSGTTSALNALWGFNGNDVYAVGSSGIILHFNGNGWSPQESGSAKTLRAIWGNTLTAEVFVAGDQAALLHYNGGNWSAVSPGTGVNLFGIWGNPYNEIFITGADGTIMHK